jgi:hypothetical protein
VQVKPDPIKQDGVVNLAQYRFILAAERDDLIDRLNKREFDRDKWHASIAFTNKYGFENMSSDMQNRYEHNNKEVIHE